MNLEYKKPNILFFKKINPDNYLIEEIFRLRLIESIEDTKSYDVIDSTNTKIPSCFTTLEDWPKKTNIKCWSCHRQFEFTPVTIITNHKDVDGKRISSIEGIFSSFPCAMLYIEKNYSGERMRDITRLLYELFNIFNGVYPIYIMPMIEPYNMSYYGGNMSAEEYDKEEIRRIKMCTNNFNDDV